MARNKQPRELAELKGAHKKDPQRYRNKVPKNAMGLGDPPAHMVEAAKTIWREIEAFALPGVLTGSERFLMEMLANLMLEYRIAPIEFTAAKYSIMISAFARLGMSPADRQKLGVKDDKKPENEFDEF